MKVIFILLLLVLISISGYAQETVSAAESKKNTSTRLTIPETELEFLKIKYIQKPENIEVSEGATSKNPTNRLLISENDQEILKSRFIFSAEKITKNENRKQIVTDPDAIGYFLNNIQID